MKEPDVMQFRGAMQKEMDNQLADGDFSLIKRSQAPKGCIIPPAAWQLKCKRDIRTREVKKAQGKAEHGWIQDETWRAL